ncbi:MAG: DegQ family serine endoprotease [Acidobacteriota bacterium]
MNFRNRSVLAGAALVAVGAVAGAWVTAKTGQFPFSYAQVPAAAQTNADLDVSFKTGFGAVVKRVQPAVVSVHSTTNAKPQSQSRRGNPNINPNMPDGFDLRDFFGGQFPGGAPDVPQGRREGLGSGVIVSPDGYIVTNHHVVDGADKVEVSLNDGRDFTAKVVGKDDKSDVAVLKIDATNLPNVMFGNSDSVEVGDIVLALGNPFGIGQTVTMGIVGATHRNTTERIEEYEDFIQTDAAINPGNSGGPLVNLKGELIGINTAILSRSGGNQGVGFAIPAKTAHNVMDQLVKHGKVSRGMLGVMIQPVTPAIAKQFGFSGSRGALVGDVTSGSPAEKAGLKAGDIITEINGSGVADYADLRVKVASMAPNTSAKLKVFRDGAAKDFTVVLGSTASEERASSDAGSSNSDGPKLGIGVEPAGKRLGKTGQTGLVITSVEPGSAADEAGLRQGDVILEVNRKPVNEAADLQKAVAASKNESLLLYVDGATDRNGKGAGKHFVPVQPR